MAAKENVSTREGKDHLVNLLPCEDGMPSNPGKPARGDAHPNEANRVSTLTEARSSQSRHWENFVFLLDSSVCMYYFGNIRNSMQ